MYVLPSPKLKRSVLNFFFKKKIIGEKKEVKGKSEHNVD